MTIPKQILEAKLCNKDNCKEITRLNNIINELEKWLEKGIMAQDYPTKVSIICKNTLDKLKELKEGNND